jgi:hypothetical protein
MVALGLVDPGVDEYLHAPKQVAAMVVIPGGNDYRQIRPIGILMTHTFVRGLH